MARIPLDETPIFTQLAQEYAAREAYAAFFDTPTTETRHFIVSTGKIQEFLTTDD